MRVFIKKTNVDEWFEITKYIDFPLNIAEVADETDSNLSFSALFFEENNVFDIKYPIPPKMAIKTTNNEDENPIYFETNNNNSARLRKADDNVGMLYEHKVTAKTFLGSLERYYLPNYTIRQPKTEFFDTRIRQAKISLDYGSMARYVQDGSIDVLPMVNAVITNEMNNGVAIDRNIQAGYENNAPFVLLKDTNKASYNLNVSIATRKTAPGFVYKSLGGGVKIKRNVYAVFLEPPRFYQESISRFTVIYDIKHYDDNDNLLYIASQEVNVDYNGGEIPSDENAWATPKILGYSNIGVHNAVVNVPKYEDSSYARVHITNILFRDELNGRVNLMGDLTSFLTQDIPGQPNDGKVKTLIENISISATSSAFVEEQEEDFITWLQFVEKAVHDYNYNQRDKVYLSEKLKTLLDDEAKEGEYADYNLRELLTRVLKYKNKVPTLDISGEISYLETTQVARYIDLELAEDNQREHLNEDFYDKVVSTSKNLMSEDDDVTEVVLITSLETEFSQITDDNVGFIESNDIYYVKKGILHTPGLEINFGNAVIKTNIGEDYKWDITSRLFEEDIYNSFPNVRFDYWEDGRTNPGLLGQGNTFSYKSGSNIVSNITHQAPEIPEFHALAGNISNYAEYSMIEAIIVLATQELLAMVEREEVDFEHSTNPEPNIEWDDITEYLLEITYVPIIKEITTKYTSNQLDRKGLHFEKKLNTNERVISYQENEKVLRKEMERKGNVKDSFKEVYNSYDESIPVNSVVNDKLYVTNKLATVFQNKVEVEYILQKNFLMQNEDVRLSTEYERYAVPYEYVNREIMLENHLIFSKTDNGSYLSDKKGCSLEFINQVLFGNDNVLNKPLYANLKADDSNYLMRIAKLYSNFTFVLTGRFLDNYTAGMQRYSGSEDLTYTQPLRYTDGHGKFMAVEKLEIGFDDRDSTLRLWHSDNKLFPINVFPDGDNALINTQLDFIDEDIILRKDAREGISLNHTSFLETRDNEIRWYSFKNVNKVANLVNNIELSDDVSGVLFSELEFASGYYISVSQEEQNLFKVRFESNATFTNNDIDYGMVFLHDNEIAGIIKNVYVDNNGFDFYITSTRYGFTHEFEDVNYIEISTEQNYNLSMSASERSTILIGANQHYGFNLDKDVGEAVYVLVGANQNYNFGLESSEIDITFVGITTDQHFNFEISGSGTKKYTVTFKRAWDNTVIKTQEVDVGGNATFPTNAQINYGYGYEADGYTGSYTNVTEDRTVTIKRKITYVTITWKRFGGSTVNNTVQLGTTVYAPSGTSNTAEWLYSWPVNSVVATSSQTINETRVKQQYTITWESYFGTKTNQTVDYGTTVYAPSNTSQTVEWVYSWPVNSVYVTKNQTVYETRAKRKYTITWNANGGSLSHYSNLLEYATNPSGYAPTGDKAGYVLSGWSPTFTPVTGNKTYTAQWTQAVMRWVDVGLPDGICQLLNPGILFEGTACSVLGETRNVQEHGKTCRKYECKII